jgi:hypothetical protein
MSKNNWSLAQAFLSTCRFLLGIVIQRGFASACLARQLLHRLFVWLRQKDKKIAHKIKRDRGRS